MSDAAPDALPGAAPVKKKRRKKSGTGGAKAEVLVQNWLELDGWLVYRAVRGGFTNFKKKDGSEGAFTKSYDMYGALDLLAIQRENIPETWGLQVTTQSGLSERRAKIASIDQWPTTWRISLVTHETTPDPAKRTRKIHYLRFEDYTGNGWLEAVAVRIDHVKIEAHREAKVAAAKAESKARAEERDAKEAAKHARRSGGESPQAGVS